VGVEQYDDELAEIRHTLYAVFQVGPVDARFEEPPSDDPCRKSLLPACGWF